MLPPFRPYRPRTKIVCPPLDPRVRKHNAATFRVAALRNPNWLELRRRLLALGGFVCCVPMHDPDLPDILARGQCFAGRAIPMPGAVSRCHMNAARLWDANRDQITIATGYALSPDGIWRQHSWGVRCATGQAIETTVSRLRYYGFLLTPEACARFWEDNAL